MSKRRSHRSIRIDDRARVPFSIIAIILLLSSVTIVYALEAREAPETSAAQSAEMDQTRAAAQAQLRDSVRSVTQRAAAAPITEANSDSAIGAAIGTSESGDTLDEGPLFENYVSVMLYREAQRTFTSAEQDARGGTHTAVDLPEVDWSDESEVRDAIDRVEIAHNGSDDDVEAGLVEVTIDDVSVSVLEGDALIDRRTEPMSVTVGSAVFELRDRTQQYDDSLDRDFNPANPTGFGTSFAARMYPYTWGRAYFDRLPIGGTGPGERTFPYVMDHNHTEVFANQALFATQEEVFGTRDPYHNRVMRGPQLCMASDLVNSTTKIYNENQIVDVANRSTPGVAIDNPEDLCNNELLMGDASGDMGELNFFELAIAPLFSKANEQFQGQDIQLLPMAEMAYAETAIGFDYDDRSAEFREDLNDSDRFNETFLDGHFGDSPKGNENVSEGIEESDRSFDEVRGSDEARTFENVVDDVYGVGLSVDADTDGDWISIGSTSSPGPDYAFEEREWSVGYSSIDVERTEPIDEWSGRNDTLVTVEVTHTASVSATDVYENVSDSSDEQSVYAGSDTVSLQRTYEIDGTLAPDAKAWGMGASSVEHIFDDTSDPLGSNWQGAPSAAYDAVFDPTDLESALSTNGGDLQSALDSGSSVNAWFDSHLDDSISVESSPDDIDMSPSGRTGLYTRLGGDVRGEHMGLVTEMDPVNATMVEIVEGNPSPIAEFRGPVVSNQTAAAREVTSRTDTYESALVLAEAEARYAYYQNLLNRIDALATLNEDTSGSLTDGLDFDVMEHLEFITDFTAADVETSTGEVRGGPLLEDVDYQIDASPTYLEMDTVNRSVDPAVRPAGNGPLDVADTEHASMASRYQNGFGFPGFPLLPFPPSMFYLQVDVWHATLQGEYARFEVQATSGSGSSTGGTTLVRENRTVSIADQNVGSVEPVTLDQKLPVFVVVPAPTVLPKGSPGVGDMWRQEGEPGYDCTDTWDATGPGYSGTAHCQSYFTDLVSQILNSDE